MGKEFERLPWWSSRKDFVLPIPGKGTRIPHATWGGNAKKKKEREFEKEEIYVYA